MAVYMVCGQTDYCAKALCGTEKHIACNNKGAWALTCPTSPAPFLIDMNLTLRQHLVRLHNVRRNNLALGKVAKYNSARRMATMRWSPELAKLAELNARQCQMKHDACHNTNKFKSSGQNLAIISGSSETDEQLLTACINMWWNENKNANMAVINSYPKTWTGDQIGHFTAMAQQPNYAVGCAAARYVSNKVRNFLLVCNYATTNIIDRAVYVRGPTAAGCNTGTNVNYPGLCTVNEVFTV
ncbi:antigen 5 like allergen Cul n 1-like [Drosophila innubila]|uniref:antigen 5 like allergen Cul n 1-like n=1 Tax=Drosophila innubila TaxID=198719 RepID=UPI00148C23AC|nr:antigen 5 like allergen Cul n 1-like [Drosophila innubila]